MIAGNLQALMAGSVVFTLTVLVLAMFVLAVRRLLTPPGYATVTLGGQRELQGRLGDSLLNVLGANGIHLPAACGGKRSCGQCHVRVVKDAPPLTAIEADLLPGQLARKGERLACMLTLRRDIEIQLPEGLADAQRWCCKLESARHVGALLKEIVLKLPAGEHIDFEAGAYVLVEALPHHVKFEDFKVDNEYRADWDRFELSNLVSETGEMAVRAYSLANPPAENDRAILLVRLALPPFNQPRGAPPGICSSWLYSLEPGDEVWIRGPFGDFHATPGQREMVLIGGGAGMAPLRSIILDQLENGAGERRISFWYGARTLRELCYRQQFDHLAARHPRFNWQAALSEPEPGTEWSGPTGFIHTVVLEQYLDSHPSLHGIDFYICGPPLMNVAVKQMLEDLGINPEAILLDDFGEKT